MFLAQNLYHHFLLSCCVCSTDPLYTFDSNRSIQRSTRSLRSYALDVRTFCRWDHHFFLSFFPRVSSKKNLCPFFLLKSFLQICRAERELFECAFPLESGDASSALWTLVEPLGSILHDVVRPQYIQLNDIYTLAELVDVLSGEASGSPFTLSFVFSFHCIRL